MSVDKVFGHFASVRSPKCNQWTLDCLGENGFDILDKSVYFSMQIERTNKEILIRVASDTDLTGLQRILDYIKYREIASKSKATQEQIDELAREAKSTWWEDNKDRFIK